MTALLLAYSALAVSALYLVLAWMLNRRHKQSLRLLIEAFMALGVAFLTLASRSRSMVAGVQLPGRSKVRRSCGSGAVRTVGCRGRSARCCRLRRA